MAGVAKMDRYGGELPQGSDVLADQPAELGHDVLAFSHGRAALAWYLDAHADVSWAVHCAYTCPTVPSFFARRGLQLKAFDVGASVDEVVNLVADKKGEGLILIPALFGRNPWLDVGQLSRRCGPHVHIVIDAAQTAFGHEDYVAPRKGAVLSCPRKACALGSGAFLRLSAAASSTDLKAVQSLPAALGPSMDKRKARAYFKTGNPDDESKGLALAVQCEQEWPDTPHRMDDEDLQLFMMIDGQAHRRRRRANAERLWSRISQSGIRALDDRAGVKGVPFNFPVLLPSSVDRSQLLASLRDQRVFATSLWPDCDIDPLCHKLAASYRDHLVALPIDQRFDDADIDEIASRFMSCLLN